MVKNNVVDVTRFKQQLLCRILALIFCGWTISSTSYPAVIPVRVAGSNTTAPDTTGSPLIVGSTAATFTKIGINSNYMGPAIAANGGVAFYAELVNSGSTGDITIFNNSGFWTSVDGTLKLALQRRVTPMPVLSPNSISTTFNVIGTNGSANTFQPVLTPGGNFAFRAESTSGSIYGLWKTSAGTIQAIAQENQTIGSTVFTTFNNAPALNDAGNSAFAAFTTGSINNVYANIGGVTTTLAAGGGTVVDTSGNPISGQTYGISLVSWPVINSNSDIVFTAAVDGNTAAAGTQGGIFSTRDGGAVKAVYNASITAPATYYRNVNGTVTTPASIIPAANFTGFGQPGLNSLGNIAFSALTNTGSTGSDSGIYIERVSSPGVRTLTLVAKENDNIATMTGLTTTPNTTLNRPGLPTNTSIFGNFITAASTPATALNRPILNDNGTIAFVANIGNVTTSPGLFTYANDGTYALIARSGIDINNVVAPGTSSGIYFLGSNAFRNPALNNRGMVAFVGTIGGTGVSVNDDLGLWYTNEEGVLTLIAREGGSFTYQDPSNPSVMITNTIASDITSGNTGQDQPIAFLGGASGTEGHGTGLSDAGIAFGLTFVDGTSGVFTINFTPVPEPGTWALMASVTACLVLARRRRIHASRERRT